MFSKGNGKDKNRKNNQQNTTNASTNRLFGHKRMLSGSSATSTLPDFSVNPNSNDITSLASSNSFGSLPNVRSANNLNNSVQWSFGTSSESLNSLPEMKPSNTSSFTTGNPSKGKRRNFFSHKTDKSRNRRSVFSPSPQPLDASTIMEDDESDHVLNVPMLPAFNESSNQNSSNSKLRSGDLDDDIPRPRRRVETETSDPNAVEPTFSSELKEAGYLPTDMSVEDHQNIFQTDSNKYLKSTIDQDFDVNFSKDSEMPRGEKIFEIRKQKRLQQKAPVTFQYSSDDDTSTEGESSQEGEGELKQYIPNKDHGDNASVKSGNSQNSVKRSIKNFFRKRAFSLGSESVKSNKKDKRETDTQSIEKKNETEKPDESCRSFGTDDTKSASPIPKAGSLTNENEKDSEATAQNSDESNSKKAEGDGSEEVDELDEKEVSSIPSSSKGENFLKNIFHLDGLLGQGGMVPHLNLSHNQKYPQGYDEENPPNFQNEIKEEAQVLVGHMFRNPAEQLRRRNRQNNEEGTSEQGNYDNNNNQPVNNGIGVSTGTGSTNNYMYVPDRAHLPIDPFDDLQDIHKLSIDVPENVKDKPRKYRAGIQSTLFQLYNTHLLPSSVSTTTSSIDGTTLMDQEMNNSTTEFNDLNMDLGTEIRKNGLGALHPHEPATVLDAELPEIGTKMEELTEDAETHLDGFSRIHKRASSLQSKLFGPEKLKFHGSSEGRSGSKRKTDVTFELPNFTAKPSASGSFTPYEKQELQGYKNLKRRAKFNKKLTKETAARITVHIADVLERQRFILTLCKAFMLYGAPTHRLEEYMSMTAQVLEIDGSFIYFPGCMLVSFGDLNARTSEMKLVRCAQGLNLGKLDEVHDVYKNVVHDRLGTVEGYELLDAIMNRKPRFNAWWCIFFYSVASVAVAPWSFGGSWIDLPICFGVGAIIAFLQFVVCPKNTLYSSVFEVSSSIIASFIARAIGSINGGNTFCYAAIVQSSLALILPGYIILCGSLELQSRNIVAGSVRMFYAFIYSLMLSFGLTLGAALYGWLDKNATSATSCQSDISPWFYFLFIPLFTIGIALTNQASWSQLPMMSFISGAGYVVSYFSSKHFKEVTELNATLGCFIIGLVANIYSRMLKSFNKYFTTRGSFMTVSLMLPAIFVQVPSGIASQGSVFTGINTANNLVHSNGTASSSTASDTNSLSFGMVMIQVALGISVGLYLSTILVYPFGKKNTGIFTL